MGGYNEIKNNEIIKVRCSEPGLHIFNNDNILLYYDKLISSKLTNDNKYLKSTPSGRIYTKLYKRNILKDVKFNTNISISEDTLYLIELIPKIRNIGVVNNIWYNYYKNDYSLTHKKIDNDTIINIMSFINEIYKKLELETDEVLKNSYRMRILKSILNYEYLFISNNLDSILKKELLIDVFSNLKLNKYIDITDYELEKYNQIRNILNI